MFPLRSNDRGAFSPELVNEPVRLRPARLSDYAQWAAVREASRDHLTAWEEAWSPIDIAEPAFRRRVRYWDRLQRRGAGLSLFVFECATGRLVGGVTLSNLRFGASRSGALGYWIGADFVRRGFGHAAVVAMVRHGFETIGLHRIEAACQPGNTTSRRLLERLGFQREGCARGFLRINGEWRDHDMYSLLVTDPGFR